MGSRLVFVHDRLDRAEKQLDIVDELICIYLKRAAGTWTGEYDPDVEAIRFHRQPIEPAARIATIAGEAIHSLRSSPDHLAWQLVLENGGTPNEETRFPILKVAPSANRHGRHPAPHVSGGVSDVALALIQRSQPYWDLSQFAETDALYVLHRLSIIDKHRHVTVKGEALNAVGFGGGFPMDRPFTFRAELVTVGAHGADIRLVPNEPDMDVEGSATLHIVIHEQGGIDLVLAQTLRQAHDRVLSIVSEAEATCFT